MVSAELVRTALGVIGNITSVVLFLSTVPTFYGIWKKGTVEQYSPVPYLAAFFNCGLWVLYGIPFVHPQSLLVLTTNGAGFAIELVYLVLFIIYSDRKMRLRAVMIILVEILSLGVLALLVLTLVHTTHGRSTIVGSIGIAANIMMYASPLSIMKLVITTKSVEYMPFCLSLFCFANGLCWFSYALIHFDPFVAVPNGIGAILGMIQLILYATFYNSTKRLMAVRKAQEEMGLAEMPTYLDKKNAIYNVDNPQAAHV